MYGRKKLPIFEEIKLCEIAFFRGVAWVDEKMDEFHAMLKMVANL